MTTVQITMTNNNKCVFEGEVDEDIHNIIVMFANDEHKLVVMHDFKVFESEEDDGVTYEYVCEYYDVLGKIDEEHREHYDDWFFEAFNKSTHIDVVCKEIITDSEKDGDEDSGDSDSDGGDEDGEESNANRVESASASDAAAALIYALVGLNPNAPEFKKSS